MLLNRVKIIALCAGGWVLVAAAYVVCGTLVLPDPRYKCPTVATNSTWVNKLGSIVVDNTDPRWCPVIIYGPPGTIGFQSYASNVQLNAAALDPSRPRVDYSFANANNVTMKSATNFFTIVGTLAVTTPVGDYDVGTAGNVATKRDYVHNTIYTNAGPATGAIYLDYNYRANPTINGPSSQAHGDITVTASTPLVQQPVTYQWWVNNVSQGVPTGSNEYYQRRRKIVTAAGGYTFKVVIKDKRNISYTLTKTVLVTAACPTGKRC